MTRFTSAAAIVANAFSNDWALKTTRGRQVDMPHVVHAAAEYFGVPVDHFKGLDTDPDAYGWEFAAEVMLALGLDTVDAINAYGQRLADRRWAAAKAREAAADLATSEFDYHVSGCDARGMELMDTAPFSDMGMYASMATLEQAEAWATNAFATDARVQQVSVTMYRRSRNGGGWEFHQGVKTIHRAAA